jgi:hypothetical protein
VAPGGERAAEQRQGVCDEGVDTVLARSSLVATGRCDAGAAVPYEGAAEGAAEERSRPWSRFRGAAQQLLMWCPGTTMAGYGSPAGIWSTRLSDTASKVAACSASTGVAPSLHRGPRGSPERQRMWLLCCSVNSSSYSPTGCFSVAGGTLRTGRQGSRRRPSQTLCNSLLHSLFGSCFTASPQLLLRGPSWLYLALLRLLPHRLLTPLAGPAGQPLQDALSHDVTVFAREALTPQQRVLKGGWMAAVI